MRLEPSAGLNWWRDPSEVPYTTVMLVDDLESQWRDTQFAVIIRRKQDGSGRRGTRYEYEVIWEGHPTSEAVHRFMVRHFGHLPNVDISLNRMMTVHRGGGRRKFPRTELKAKRPAL